MPCETTFFDGFVASSFVASGTELLDRTKTPPGMVLNHRHSIAGDCVPDWIGRSYVGRNVIGSHGLYNWCCNYHGQSPAGGRGPCQQVGVQMISWPLGPAIYCGQTGAHGGDLPPGSEYQKHGACPAMCDVDFLVFEDCGVGEDVGYDFGLEVNNDQCGIPPGIFVQWNTPVDGDIIQFPLAKTEYYQCCSGISKTFFDANGPYLVEIALRWRTDNCQFAIYCLGIEVRIIRVGGNPALQCIVRNSGESGIPWDCYSANHHEGEPASGFWEGPVEYPPPEGGGQIWLLYDTETQQEVGWFIFRPHVN